MHPLCAWNVTSGRPTAARLRCARAVLPSDPQPTASSPAFGEGGFEPYVRAIRRHPVLTAVVTLATLAGAGAWLLVRPPEYRATAEVLVTPAPYDEPAYLGLQVPRDTPSNPTRVLQTAAVMIDSRPAAALTARRVARGLNAREVREAVTVEPRGESNVLAVQATAGSPRLAARIANTFARTVLEQRSQALRTQAATLLAQLKAGGGPSQRQYERLVTVRSGIDPAFSLLATAPVPTSPVGTPAWRVLVLSLVAGLALGVAAALLRDGVARRSSAQEELVELSTYPGPATPTKSASG
jgi:uncharacterized protein involved in exopolysaccharide biosynthesis